MKNIRRETHLKSKVLIVLSLFFFICFSLTANAQEKETIKPEGKQRGLIKRIPKHLPIKVEILNEDTDDTLKDVRIKVTNTGEKPIYYLMIFVETKKDFVGLDGNPYAFILKYGRDEMLDVDEFSNSVDVPIEPGESYEFKIDEILTARFKNSVKKKKRELPKFYLLRFQMMNFGDGTGFLGAGGSPVSSNKRTSLLFNKHISPRKSAGFFLTKRVNHPALQLFL